MVQILNSGQFGGARTFSKMAGKYFWPPHLVIEASGTTVATTAARYYIVPWEIEEQTNFAGAWCYNGGAGDNGDTFKMGLFQEAAGGGPGALFKSFGEGTFGASAAVNLLASSVTVPAGRYYLEFVTNAGVTMYSMSAVALYTLAGIGSINIAASTMGIVGTPSIGASLHTNVPANEFVAGTYANFPEATSLTPTASTFSTASTPLCGLYT